MPRQLICGWMWKFVPDRIIRIKTKTIIMFTRWQLWTQKLVVKWVSGLILLAMVQVRGGIWNIASHLTWFRTTLSGLLYFKCQADLDPGVLYFVQLTNTTTLLNAQGDPSNTPKRIVLIFGQISAKCVLFSIYILRLIGDIVPSYMRFNNQCLWYRNQTILE